MAFEKRRNGYYEYKDAWVPSVTTILRCIGSAEGLVRWGAIQGGNGVYEQVLAGKSIISFDHMKELAVASLEKERERTADVGTNAHALIEAYLRGKPVASCADETAWKIYGTMKDFCTEIELDCAAIEAILYGDFDGMKFAGRTDFIANNLDPKVLAPYMGKKEILGPPCRTIGDFKTGTSFREQSVLQLAAYRQADPSGAQAGLIINVAREKPEKIKLYYFTAAELDEAYAVFMQCYNIWKYLEAPQWWFKQFQ